MAGIPYCKKVVPPTPRELVNVPPEDLQRILKIPVARSDNVTEDGSVFTAYTAAVSTHKEVRDLYLKLKMVQPSAKHIVCSYWVDHPEEYYALDYHDDGEHTVGRLLMDFLKENDLKNRVIFVARRYGGVKMGAARFNCYLKVAKQSIIKGQFNHVLQTEQQVICDDPRMIRKPRSTIQRSPEQEAVVMQSQTARQQLIPKSTRLTQQYQQTMEQKYHQLLELTRQSIPKRGICWQQR